MKKILLAMLALLCLCACTSKPEYSKLSDGEDVIYEANGKAFTKNDLYKILKVSSKDAIETDILNKIAEDRGVDVALIKQEADEYVQMYIEYGYESYIISYYGSLEAFKSEYINGEVLYKLSYDYCLDKYDESVAADRPVLMQYAYFDDEETANKVIEDINGGADFEAACEGNGYTYDIPMNVYVDSDSTLPVEIKQYLNSTATTGISTIIPTTVSTQDADGNFNEKSRYYILNIESKNPDEFKEDYIALKQEGVDPDILTANLFSQYDIEYFDQDIYDMMNEEGE